MKNILKNIGIVIGIALLVLIGIGFIGHLLTGVFIGVNLFAVIGESIIGMLLTGMLVIGMIAFVGTFIYYAINGRK